MVSIQVFGELRLLIDGKPVSPGRPGARALLAWLALNEGPHRRADIRDELDLPSGAFNLALFELNRALSSTGLLRVASRGSKEIELIRDPRRLAIDYERLQVALTDGVSDPEREEIFTASAGKTLLDGLDVEYTPDWLRTARARAESELVDLATTSADALEVDGDVNGALWWARAWLEIDPLKEAAVRRVMRLQLLSGRRDRAIDAAEAYVEAAGEAVSAEFRQYIEAVRRGETDARREQPVMARIPVASEVDLVGRTDVVEFLWKAVLRAKDGREVVFLKGDAGMGKTRVVRALGERLIDRSRTEGAAVLYGRFEPRPREFGEYGGIAMALWSFLDHWQDPRVLRAQLGDDAPVLLRLLPGLRDRLPTLEEAPAISPGTDRLRLNAAVAALFARIARGGPTIVVLDDLHYADRSSLDLLQHIINATTAPGLLLVCTLRPACPPHVAEAVVAITADQEPSTRDLSLLPLGAEETRRFAEQQLGGRDLTEPEADRIYDQSRGVPFHIEQAARGLDPARTPLDEDPELDPETTRLLAIAALIGHEFSVDTLAQVADVPADKVVQRLAQVTGDPGIVAADGPDRYRFTHALRHDLFASSSALDERERRTFSKHAARVETDAGAPAALLARLWRQAGDLELAVTALSDSAGAAEGALAYEDAAVALAEAHGLVGSDDGSAEQRCSLLLRRGDMLRNAGHFRASREVFEQAADVAANPVQLGEAALGYSGRLGFQGVTSGTTMTELQRRALAGLPEEDTPLRARLLACLGQAQTFAGRRMREDGARLSREAEAMARRLANQDATHRDLLVDVLCRTCWTTWSPSNLTERRGLADEIVMISREIQEPVRLLESLVFRVCGQVEAGEFDAAWEDLTEADALAASLSQPYYLALVRFARGMFEMLDAPAHGQAAAHEALNLGHRQEHPGVMQLFGVQIMYVYLQLNRAEELLSASRDLSACYPDFAAWRAGLALIYAEIGMLTDAAHVAHKLLDEGIPNDMFWLVCADHLARVVAKLHDTGQNEDRWLQPLYDSLLQYRDRYVIVGGAVSVYSSVEHPLGLLAAANGRTEDALEHFGRAQRRAAQIKCRAAEAEARVELARLQLGGEYGAAQVADAIVHLERAVATADECRLARTARLVEELAPTAVAYAQVNGEQALAARARDAQILAGKVVAREFSPRGRVGLRAAIGGPAVARAAELFGRIVARKSDAQLEGFFAKPLVQKTVFEHMADSYNAERGLGFVGEVGFEILLPTQDTQVHWRINVTMAGATAEPRKAVDPQVLIRVSLRNFVGFLTKRLNGVQAWVEGQLEVEGDPVLAARLVEMFGGEAALVVLTQ